MSKFTGLKSSQSGCGHIVAAPAFLPKCQACVKIFAKGVAIFREDRYNTPRQPLGGLAQLVERFNGIEEVRSSSLLSSTKMKQPTVKLTAGCFAFGHAKRWIANDDAPDRGRSISSRCYLPLTSSMPLKRFAVRSPILHRKVIRFSDK